MMLAYKLSLISILAKWTIIESLPLRQSMKIQQLNGMIAIERGAVATISPAEGSLFTLRVSLWEIL